MTTDVSPRCRYWDSLVMMRVTLQRAITMDVIMTVISKIFFIVLLFLKIWCKDNTLLALVFLGK